MRRFKLKQGNASVYEINKENFERLTERKEPYLVWGDDNQKRCFGVCPACDNPVQLIGIYKKLKNTDKPYGKHYNRDADIAEHNEQAYYFCPYAAHKYSSDRKIKKDELTDFEKNIYYEVRENFDYAIYLAGQVSGLKINEKFATWILDEYLSSEGYMYYGATYYNIPWMLLYFCVAKPVYGLLVRRESPLYEMLKEQKNVILKQYYDNDYYKVDKVGSWLDIEYSTILHNRKVEEDEVAEEIRIVLSSRDSQGLPTCEAEKVLYINEYRFPNLVNSEKARQYRNERLREIARNKMPDLD